MVLKVTVHVIKKPGVVSMFECLGVLWAGGGVREELLYHVHKYSIARTPVVQEADENHSVPCNIHDGR